MAVRWAKFPVYFAGVSGFKQAYEARDVGGIILTGKRHPSSILDHVVRGADFDKSADLETRWLAIHAVAEWQHFIDYNLGWFEHTSDWDWWVVVELYDGTVIDPGAGSNIVNCWEGKIINDVVHLLTFEVSGFWNDTEGPDEDGMEADRPIEVMQVKSIRIGYDT